MGLGIGLGSGFDYFRQYNVIRRIGIRRNGVEPFIQSRMASMCSKLQNTHRFRNRVRFGRRFWHQSKARIRLFISPSLWPWS